MKVRMEKMWLTKLPILLKRLKSSKIEIMAFLSEEIPDLHKDKREFENDWRSIETL